jgi:sulfur-carrier protein
MMVKVMLFGQLVDIAGKHMLEMEDVVDTQSLQQKIQASFPALAGSTFRIAVDKKVVTQNVPLQNDSIVALLPPFSGG